MAMKAKHAFGSEKNISKALSEGKIDSYDILFLDEKKVGWINKDGEVVIAETDLSGIEAELATKAGLEEINAVEAKLATKANAEYVRAVEAQVATKADAAEVELKINNATQNTVDAAKAYTDGKVEAAINEHMVKKYEISCVPEGTLVDYREKEIRVMCPADTKWAKQSVGLTGNANMYYMAFRAFAPEGAVGFKEGDQGVIIDEYFDFNGDFAGTDEFGRNYSICWLALASYDEATGTWTYFGNNSTKDKYVGWTYVVEWYDANGVIIESSSVRINLSNETCHYVIEPYYVGQITKDIDEKIVTKIEEKIKEVETSYEIIEF